MRPARSSAATAARRCRPGSMKAAAERTDAQPARIAFRICCEPAASSRASEPTVTKRKPLAARASATSGRPLWMPATTPCALARSRMWSMACAAFGSRIVEHRAAAQRQRQVARADVDRVQPFHRQDRVQVVQRLRGLDHREGDDGVVGMLRVVGARRTAARAPGRSCACRAARSGCRPPASARPRACSPSGRSRRRRRRPASS